MEEIPHIMVTGKAKHFEAKLHEIKGRKVLLVAIPTQGMGVISLNELEGRSFNWFSYVISFIMFILCAFLKEGSIEMMNKWENGTEMKKLETVGDLFQNIAKSEYGNP